MRRYESSTEKIYDYLKRGSETRGEFGRYILVPSFFSNISLEPSDGVDGLFRLEFLGVII